MDPDSRGTAGWPLDVAASMDISLLHTGLAAGAAMAAVPLLLHLMMRQTPKHVIFPALRLIKERQKRAKKRLRVKNWLLLLARMALFALMALALARPTLNTETPLGDQEVDSAIAFVVDTSLSMQYTERGNDRLKEAKVRATEILKRATDRSEIYVLDSADPVKPTAISPTLALKRIEALTLRPANRTLNAAIVQAHAAVSTSNLARREVYVLSDLTQSAWDQGSTKIAEALAKQEIEKKKVSTFLMRLTPKDVKNVAVISAEPSSTVAPQGEPLEIKAKIRSFGQKATRVAKLEIDGVARGQKAIELPETGETEAVFLTPPNLGPGVHQGSVSLTGESDFMGFDDVRYFTFTLQPALRVLLVSPTETDAFFVRNALEPDPATLAAGTPQLYKVERVSPAEFPSKVAAGLGPYAAVFLLNLDQVEDSIWGQLTTYVRGGGGLVVALGDRSRQTGYSSPIAAQLLPGKLVSVSPRVEDGFLARFDAAHPLFSKYAKFYDAEFPKVPVYRHWVVEPQGGRPCLWYSDNAPALVERTFEGSKTGHVLLWTTPLSRRAELNTTASWNEFPLSASFLGVMLETVAYLSGTASMQLNYEAGQDAILPLDTSQRASSYALSGPDPAQSDRLSSASGSSTLVVPSPQALGQWKASGKTADGRDVVYGFSVNPPSLESVVVPIDDKALEVIFGKVENFHVAEDADSLKREQAKGRIGFEAFPWLMMVILCLVTAENLLANRFHREAANAPATEAKR